MTSATEVTTAIRNCFGRFPHVRNVQSRMEELYKYRCINEEPEHLLVLGESGVGKSTLLKRFCDQHPRVQHPEYTEIPVLYAAIEPGCTIKKLASSILLKLGSDYWNKGDEIEMTHQLVCLLRGCRVRLVILDEVNHLVDRGRAQTHHNIADWIKRLTDSVRVPFVMAGIPRADRLLNANDQLRSRFREVIKIEQFSVDDESASKEFRSVLKAFAGLMAGLPSIDLTHPQIAQSFVFATDGRLRDIRRLLVRAVELAYEGKSPKLTTRVLAEAFRKVIYSGAPDLRNPFCAKFNKLPLTRPGEPFAPREE